MPDKKRIHCPRKRKKGKGRSLARGEGGNSSHFRPSQPGGEKSNRSRREGGRKNSHSRRRQKINSDRSSDRNLSGKGLNPGGGEKNEYSASTKINRASGLCFFPLEARSSSGEKKGRTSRNPRGTRVHRAPKGGKDPPVRSQKKKKKGGGGHSYNKAEG